MTQECLFCNIAKGSAPSEKIYEDGDTMAFLDIYPVNRGHTLVIPKRHAENIHDIESSDFCTLMEQVRQLAPIVKKGVNADGVNIIINNGNAAGQIIFHTHVHIIPRFEGDGHMHWRGEGYKEGEMSDVAKNIRTLLG